MAPHIPKLFSDIWEMRGQCDELSQITSCRRWASDISLIIALGQSKPRLYGNGVTILNFRYVIK